MFFKISVRFYNKKFQHLKNKKDYQQVVNYFIYNILHQQQHLIYNNKFIFYLIFLTNYLLNAISLT